MSPPDLGTELWGLAVHLFSTRESPSEAFRELTGRTRSTCYPADVASVNGVRSLRSTRWYAEMQERYTKLRTSLVKERRGDLDELAEVVKSLYPRGCSASGFTDAVQTCTAMLSFTITETAVSAFIEEKCDDITSHAVHEVSADELVSMLADGLMLDAMVPARWYADRTDKAGSAAVSVRRVGLRLRPLALAIEYDTAGHGKVRHRTIPLEGVLAPSGPTGPIARRLFQSHGWLLSEAELQRLLIKLQHLLARQSDEEATAEAAEQDVHKTSVQGRTTAGAAASQASSERSSGGPAAADVVAAAAASGAGNSQGKRSGKPQKADVGLLYRDPEAALADVDLNDADDVTLQEFKDAMNEKFVANVLKPGDAGYEYDRRVEVAPPTQKSAWDDDSDEDA